MYHKTQHRRRPLKYLSIIVEAEKIVNTSHIFSKLLSRMKKKKKSVKRLVCTLQK